MNKFKKVVILDTVIFYPEHEKVLKELVENPLIERVPLEYDQSAREWRLPDDYVMPSKANIIIWPSSLPESFDGISSEVHEKLKTGQCYVEQELRNDIPAQNLLNRIKDADCIITCWTAIPDVVLDNINPKAILTWTHEYEHRLNVKKANEKGIFTACVDDYGTDSVAELEYAMLIELIARNKKKDEVAKTDSDIAFGVLQTLFVHYRKMQINEKNTRKGKFSHQFHKIGRSLMHYGDLKDKMLDEIIPPKLIEGKKVGFVLPSEKCNYLIKILQFGFKMNLTRLTDKNFDAADFYKLLSLNDYVIYDSAVLDKKTVNKILTIKKNFAIDVQSLSSYNETLKDKVFGVVGLGRIGGRVSKIAQAFEMKVIHYGNKKDVNYKNVELDNLLQSSDVISLNIKAHKVKNLLNKDKFNLIKKEAYLINTSDGNILDQKSLTRRMLQKDLFVGLDVYQGLPTTKVMYLDDDMNGKIKNELSNHVLTYRAGWATQESIRVKTYKLIGHMIKILTD